MKNEVICQFDAINEIVIKPVRFRVLIAEDDDEMRNLMAYRFRKAGYEVEECHNGWEMFTFIESIILSTRPLDIDLIVTDICMPGVTGMEILEGTQKIPGFPPMVIITAFGDQKTHEEAETFGAVAIFDKPFDTDELLCKVNEILMYNV